LSISSRPPTAPAFGEVAAPSVAERLAQRGDLKPQIALVDKVRPYAGDELILVNGVARAFNERD
jgi:hypothetical protein